jgi:DNA polymerase
MTQKYLGFDFETRSECDLKTAGAFEYAKHPSTEVLCVAWRIGTKEELAEKPTRCWNVKLNPDAPKQLDLVKYLNDPDILLFCHNANFEQVITEFVLPKHVVGLKPIPLSRWICTAALAATHALPRSLDGATSALELPHLKDAEGVKLVKRHCIPQRITKKQKTIWNDDPAGLERLALYCARDVTAHTHLFLRLPPLTPTERRVWLLNQKINRRGVHIDRELAKAVTRMMVVETSALRRKAVELTGGIEPTQNAEIKRWCARKGVSLPNMQKKTIDDAITSGLVEGLIKQVLLIRQSASKTSTGKYAAFLARTKFDSILRDFVMYHGASTGRDTARGPQVHNQPRGTLGELYELAVEIVMTGDLEWVRALLGDPMSAFSSLLRAVITARPGLTLYSGDFNAIEARVVFWLAGHAVGLKMFTEQGRDPYREMAATIYTKKLKDVIPDEREVGKRAILGAGFGMGAPKFAMTCKQFGMPVTDQLAKRAIGAYRKQHQLVPALWKNLERAAIEATRNPGKRYTVNKTSWFVRNEFLYCELPSGRRIAYFRPSIRSELKWDAEHETLYHWGENPKTKKWENAGTYGGRLTENVVQAVARDVMVEAQLRAEDAGFNALFSVHDELVNECKRTNRLAEFEAIMAESPEWAEGLPIRVKAWEGIRYKK